MFGGGGVRMGKWRDAFDRGRPSGWDVEYGLEYTFGPPATPDQLARVEEQLGARLPVEVRELLSEFNGVWCTSEAGRGYGSPPEIVYLDTEYMTVQVPHYLQERRDEFPPVADLRRVAFVCQDNGFGMLWGVCISDVAGFRAGEVVKLDHEVAVLESCCPCLLEFVRDIHK